MVSRRLVMRLAQLTVLLAVGLWAQTAQGRTCSACLPICNGNDCLNRECDYCPATWHGQCYAGAEGCEEYDCDDDGLCCYLLDICITQCYCEACA